jgi:hypothetical protein
MKIRLAAFLSLSLLAAACDGSRENARNPDTTAVRDTGISGARDVPRDSGYIVDPASRIPDTAGLPPARIVSGRKYGVKSGIIEMAGITDKSMSSTFYFDDFGEKIATYTTVRDNLNGEPLIINQVNVMNDGWSIFFDAGQKVGMKSRMLEGTLNYYPNFDSLSERQLRLYKYEKGEPRTIAGKQAVGHSIEQNGLRANVWTWQGIPLRTESRGPRNRWLVFEATSIQTDVPVPAEKFEVPADVKLSEMPRR